MKQIITVLFSALLLLSCSKNDDPIVQPSTDLNQLQPVKYDAVADKETSSVQTGNLVFNPATNTNQFEYITTIDKQTTLNPLSIANVTNLDLIYPGSILKGSSFLNSSYEALLLKNSLNEIVITGILRGVTPRVTASSLPKLNSVRNVINSLMYSSKDQFTFNSVPSEFEYDSVDIINQKSFTASTDLHLNPNILTDLVTTNLNFNIAGYTGISKKYTMVKMRQWFYNFAVNPGSFDDWINGPIEIAQCGSHEPLFINNVDYGRIAYILIESTDSKEYLEAMISTSAKIGITGVVSGSAEQNYKARFEQLISQNKIKFLIVGGPASLGQQVSDFASFSSFVKNPTTAQVVSSSVPISYKVRRLKDNTQVEVKDIYATQIKELKAN